MLNCVQWNVLLYYMAHQFPACSKQRHFAWHYNSSICGYHTSFVLHSYLFNILNSSLYRSLAVHWRSLITLKKEMTTHCFPSISVKYLSCTCVVCASIFYWLDNPEIVVLCYVHLYVHFGLWVSKAIPANCSLWWKPTCAEPSDFDTNSN